MEDECYELRCADVVLKCDYFAKARPVDELLEKAGKLSAEVHKITSYSDEEMNGIKAAIRHDQQC